MVLVPEARLTEPDQFSVPVAACHSPPFRRNSTDATELSSDAVPLIERTGSFNRAPSDGLVIEIAGASTSGIPEAFAAHFKVPVPGTPLLCSSQYTFLASNAIAVGSARFVA